MRPAAALLGLLAVAGCGAGQPDGPPDVVVRAGPQEVPVPPVQYCLDGEGQRYQGRPPVIEVSPDTTVRFSVPPEVAVRGWSVQVFDDQLEEQLGEVDVEAGREEFDGINTSDVVPAAFYLVVVQGAVDDCDGFGGAWPVGFLRAGGGDGGMAAVTPPPPG